MVKKNAKITGIGLGVGAGILKRNVNVRIRDSKQALELLYDRKLV
jgi:hypothetical protein